MIIEAPSEDAIELYRVALRAVALAGIYPAEDVAYAIKRLRGEQGRYSDHEADWRAIDSLCDALREASA